MPPCAAVITIRPAVGGPWSTTFHSSGEKASFVVMARSCASGDADHGRGPVCSRLTPAGVNGGPGPPADGEGDSGGDPGGPPAGPHQEPYFPPPPPRGPPRRPAQPPPRRAPPPPAR